MCNCKQVEDTFSDLSILSFDISYTLCDKDTISKYGIDQCQSIEYEVFDETEKQLVEKRNGQHPNQRKKFPNDNFIKKIIDAANNTTVYNFTGLKHFATYVFYLSACNFLNKTEKTYKCSNYKYTVARTMPKTVADDITNVTITLENANVRIDWEEPKDPNSKTVAYRIELTKHHDASFNRQPICIPRDTTFIGSHWVIYNLNPGRYSIKIQSESVAGPGRYSKDLEFEIPYPKNETTIIVVSSIVTAACICIAVFMLWIRYKRKQLFDNLHLIASINPDYDTTIYIADEWEIDRNDIEIQTDLGHGTFGIVFYGKIKSRNLQCAVKTINENRNLFERMEFLNEASVMKTFSNCHHVVKLLGVVSKGEPPLVVMELMERGDLKKFLHHIRDQSESLTCKEIYRMASEIADGMAYLAAKKFIHRDLAARNCMVSGNRTVKIGDFGMARDVYETDYYKKESKGLLPVRWMAPESLADGVFTSDTDIWSYGIVLWEIATLGQQPYHSKYRSNLLNSFTFLQSESLYKMFGTIKKSKMTRVISLNGLTSIIDDVIGLCFVIGNLFTFY